MAFRFFRRMKIAPGVSVNLSKSGASMSFGPRGAKVTVGPRGVRKTVGLPGTGAYYTTHRGYGRSASRRSRQAAPPPTPTPRPEDRLSLGFFRRLLTPEGEEQFVDGMREFVRGNEAAALRHLSQSQKMADAAFMAGVLSLKRKQIDRAEQFFKTARSRQNGLGRYFEKYGIQAAAAISITDDVAAVISADRRGVLLALAEIYQHQGRWRDAAGLLKQLHRREPDDVVVRLALAELAVEEAGDKRSCQTAVKLAQGIENESEVHAGLMLYKGMALHRLGLSTAARDTLTAALRRKKDRSDELRRAIRYQRALVYEELGQHKRYRSELGKVYAEDPGYEDVAARLGFS
jgi:tetratricopeptide (TPR) repeat protein